MHRWIPILFLSTIVAAQSTTPVADAAPSPIQLPFTVTVKDKRARLSLDRKSLEIYDNGTRTSAFDLRGPSETGLDLVLLIDISGSSRDKATATKTIADRVMETLQARGYRTHVVLFNDQFAFSKTEPSRQEVESLLNQTCFQGPTALFDAVAAAAQVLHSEQRANRRAVLVLSDGNDNASRNTLEFAIQSAVREGAAVSSINLVYGRYGRMVDSGSGGKALKELAQRTGGTTLEASDSDELAMRVNQWERFLDGQYELIFVPPSGAPGGFHKIEIRTADKSLRVTAPDGYYFGPQLTPADPNRAVPTSSGVRLNPEEAQRLLLKAVVPRSPDSKGQQVKESVLVYVTVDKKGRVTSATAPCANPALGHLATDAVKEWRYTPYILNGRPVEFDSKVTVDVWN